MVEIKSKQLGLVAFFWAYLFSNGMNCTDIGHKDQPEWTHPDTLCFSSSDVVPVPAYQSPVWHPSGSFIGFNRPFRLDTSYCQEQKQTFDSAGFWLVDTNGANMRRVFSQQLWDPTWSPDGQYLAFISGGQIFKMAFDGQSFDSVTAVTSGFNDDRPQWGPTGWISFTRYTGDVSNPVAVYRIPASGGNAEFLFYGYGASWSSDGNRLIALLVGPSKPTRFIQFHIQSGYSDTLTANLDRGSFSPKFSLNGQNVVYISGHLRQMDTTGSNMMLLDVDPVSPSDRFSFSPDGATIAYIYYNSFDWSCRSGTLRIINIQTGQKKQITFNCL